MNIHHNQIPYCHLQSFENIGGLGFGQNAIPKIRQQIANMGIDGLLIPHEDEWQNEYIPPSHDRLLYATGFSGSAGLALIMQNSAHLFVDGRYTLQVKDQTDNNIFQYHNFTDNDIAALMQRLPMGSRIGFDPKTFTPNYIKRLRNCAQFNNIELIELIQNPVDIIWENRPAFPFSLMQPHSMEFSGEHSDSKREKISQILQNNNVDYFVFTSPTSIAWLFNIRGADVIRTPITLGNAILSKDGSASIFINIKKLSDEASIHLGNNVKVIDESHFEEVCQKLNGTNVGIDDRNSSIYFFNLLNNIGANIIKMEDPTILPKAIKNHVEIEGAKKAHIRDGVAVSKFLAWFDMKIGTDPITEIDAAKALEEFRAQSKLLKDLSFDTIAGSASNGAIVHYRVNNETNKIIEKNSFFLVDSGAQYPDGTTDITRTISTGEISDEMKDRFTRVLKGHIAIASIKFPEGITGSHLDILARQSLWKAGLDYNHGTGHGVGSYLGVHEGPQRISKAFADIPLKAGMIISNEPGYYKTGEYGIRIENLQFVKPPENIINGEIPMHGFEPLTLAPIDKRAIKIELLNHDEIQWLNDYHARVFKTIGPLVDEDTRDWLTLACRKIVAS